MATTRAVVWAKSNGFYLVIPVALCASLGFRSVLDWSVDPAWGEAAVLFDWCVFLPFLYAVCYRDKTPRVLAIRLLALSCSGFWVAGLIVPDAAEGLLRDWSWLRTAGLAALILVEGVAMIAVFRIVFYARPDAGALERQSVPPIVVRAMLAEARFWRCVWARHNGR